MIKWLKQLLGIKPDCESLFLQHAWEVGGRAYPGVVDFRCRRCGAHKSEGP
jgi:hypothetical protein